MDHKEVNYQFLKLMNDNKIVVLAFPSHTTHVIQPLNNVPFAQLKTAWYEAMWLQVRSVCAKKLSKGEFFKIFVPCWKKAVTRPEYTGRLQTHRGVACRQISNH